MNTATISPALDMLANKPANAQASKTPDADNNSPPFAAVLSHQHASQAPQAGQRVEHNAPSKDHGDGKSQARPDADQPDSELARLTAQSGLTGMTGVAGQSLMLDVTDGATVLRSGVRGNTAQRPEPGIVMAQGRQALSSSDLKADGDQALLRAGTAPVNATESSASLAALMSPAHAANSGDRKAQPNTTSLHQTLTNSTKAKVQGSVASNAVLNTDATKTVNLSSGKIAVSEFSTAMIDAANLARSRMSAHNAPDTSIATTSAGEQIANLTSQLLPSGPSSTAAALSIPVPLNSPQWGTDFGRQFVSLLQSGTNGSQIAELRLDPPELGPLRITLNLSDNVAHAAFFSPHAAVRQTVENALPQLQELLAQAGISLGDTSVNDQSQTAQDSGNPGGQGQASGHGRAIDNDLLVTVNDTAPATRNRAPDALVDTFA